jgi:tRNA(Ile)-lysidine synthase
LLQAAGVPPWRRRRLPLIYSGDRLAAVGDLWVADEFAARAGETAASIIWEKEEVDSR